MSADDSTMTEAQKLKALSQIQYVLAQKDYPVARASGLTEGELAALANEGMIEVFFFEDDGPDLDRYRIERILPAGLAILAKAQTADPDPLRVSVVPQHRSMGRRIWETLRSGLWDLIKVAVGVVLGWCLKKYFP